MIDKKGWEKKKLSEVGQVVTGNTPKTSDNSNYSSNDFCFFKPSDLRGNNISLLSESENNISDSAFRNSRNLPIGSVLVTCIGTIGNVGVTTVVSTSNQQINAIIPNNETDSKFLAYSICSIRSYLNHIANAPVVPIINKTQFSSVEIYIPPLPIQQQIVSELDTLSDIISKKKQQLAELDTLAQATFYDMFGDPVSNEKGWKVKPLNKITKVGTGGTPSRKREQEFYNGSINWAKTTEVKGKYIFDTEERITELALVESNCKVYPIGTILLAMYGQGKTRGNVGFLKIEAATNQACATIPPNEELIQVFLYELLKNSYEYLRGLARGGNQENLNLNIVGNIKIIIPPISLQSLFVNRIDVIEQQKTLINKSIDEVQLLFDYTMDRYFN